jgi:tetratricopeptide (TPR) repeat protein
MNALNRGNQLFRAGQIAAAVDVYLAGYRSETPNSTLAYNLGTALHRLDRLPEAILWYRRAGRSNDPWLEDNLWLARRTLGSQRLPAGNLLGRLAPHGNLLRLVGIGLAWLCLPLLVLGRRFPPWATGVAVLLAVIFYAGGEFTQRFGPHQGVFLSDCRAGESEIPAGSEAWVRQQDDGLWRIAANPQAITCPAQSIELIDPEP